ncbi:MAG: hypothetical protein GWN85_04315, partial [Gemmatimonadetes bacterium]|nr:hypothetical protein [Gemmatimonadota bacterium]NIR37797.1 hypothetical protein [Actinomycetota bacterium]NIS32313.1 hypothetical protein [Actinomycetota bacterium]NIU69041.1 hypothetical protein [Actinomycetota bacterium]NIW30900.1 hypothetical protein [Actinomycetota bacterium]
FRKGGQSIVELRTDEGVTGIGPGVDPSLLDVAGAHLLGRSPFDIEQHARVLNYYLRAVPYRGAAGFDIALWDLI